MKLWRINHNGRITENVFGIDAADAIARYTRHQGGRVYGTVTAEEM